MTDAEKMIQVLESLGQNEVEKQKHDMNNLARITKMMYDSYVKVGFTKKEALELVKEVLKSSVIGGFKK